MNRKEAVLNAAAKLFAMKGYNRTSSLEVAKEAGVAEGTIFRYFKTKEMLLAEVGMRLISNLSTELQQRIDDAPTAMDALELVIDGFFDFARSNPDYWVLVRSSPIQFIEKDSEFFKPVASSILSMTTMARQLLARGVKDGSMREVPTEETSYLMIGMMFGALRIMHLTDKMEVSARRTAIDYWKLILKP